MRWAPLHARGTARFASRSIRSRPITCSFVVEADERDERSNDVGLSRAMRSFVIRIALRLNRALGRRRGKVWGDRFHARDLTSPSEVRKALVYLLANHIKHGAWDVGLVDPFSSGPWFQGWMQVLERPPDPPSVERARTWLLDWGWHRGRDYIHLGEMPLAVRGPRRSAENAWLR